jgi:hypothetical protein
VRRAATASQTSVIVDELMHISSADLVHSADNNNAHDGTANGDTDTSTTTTPPVVETPSSSNTKASAPLSSPVATHDSSALSSVIDASATPASTTLDSSASSSEPAEYVRTDEEVAVDVSASDAPSDTTMEIDCTDGERDDDGESDGGNDTMSMKSVDDARQSVEDNGVAMVEEPQAEQGDDEHAAHDDTDEDSMETDESPLNTTYELDEKAAVDADKESSGDTTYELDVTVADEEEPNTSLTTSTPPVTKQPGSTQRRQWCNSPRLDSVPPKIDDADEKERMEFIMRDLDTRCAAKGVRTPLLQSPVHRYRLVPACTPLACLTITAHPSIDCTLRQVFTIGTCLHTTRLLDHHCSPIHWLHSTTSIHNWYLLAHHSRA